MELITLDKLKIVALKQFALKGYEGASLAKIASEVGIKKPSIYNHFKSKEDLFTQIFLDSVQLQLKFSKEFLEENNNVYLKEVLYTYIIEYLKRCKIHHNTNFYLRTAFFPLEQFKQHVHQVTNIYVNELELLFNKLFSKNINLLKKGITPIKATSTFLTVMDGLLMELLYGTPQRLERRTNDSWYVFYKGIVNENKADK